jgi:hypothetical protein
LPVPRLSCLKDNTELKLGRGYVDKARAALGLG